MTPWRDTRDVICDGYVFSSRITIGFIFHAKRERVVFFFKSQSRRVDTDRAIFSLYCRFFKRKIPYGGKSFSFRFYFASIFSRTRPRTYFPSNNKSNTVFNSITSALLRIFSNYPCVMTPSAINVNKRLNEMYATCHSSSIYYCPRR